ncbi:hypothetical protein DY000_02003753 [Brassica cretica]|uniref:SWIM-type domain-containing protein n=1 Tax=Brassica cretica TaxID=69181 RepID=A0ABQ7BS21_BRACR|nr:hypothetical protein DY000_02003753 [Brassica cretica]
MLIATASDAEDGVFPVAFAVVDAETEENWLWFLQQLKSALSESRRITFVADFQNGLKNAIPQVFEDAHHAYCLRQLADKMNTDLKGQFSHEARRYMLNDFYSVAYATTPEGYCSALESMKNISPDACKWVTESEPHHWANALFQGERYNQMYSTFGLDFYSWVSEAHEFPITQMIDEFRAKMMQSIYTRQVQSRDWVTTLTPTNEEKLQKEMALAQTLQVSPPEGSLFQVNGGDSSINIVDIDQCDCDCKIWRLTGLPCSHAVAVIMCIEKSPYEYCSRYLTVESHRLMYAESIHPVPNMDRMMMEEAVEGLVAVTPPPTRRTPGRPKMKRVEPLDMIKRQLQCSKCKGLGHNKKTCKAD